MPGWLAAELPDLGELVERADVEDRHVRAVGAQDDRDSPVLHVGGDDREARVALDQLAQSSAEEIVKAGEDDGDGGLGGHGRSKPAGVAVYLIGETERKGEHRLTRSSPANSPQDHPSGRTDLGGYWPRI